MKKCAITILLSIVGTFCFSQNLNDPLAKTQIIPLTPEAAGLGKYGDINVGQYTGVPNVTVPIHEVKIGSLTLPIALGYQGSAIGVTQEATSVGLGWNLIAGGSINYLAVGGNDKVANHFATWDQFKSSIDYVSQGNVIPTLGREDDFIGWECAVPGQGNTHVASDFIKACLGGSGEPDIYSAYFLNHSFKFIISPKDGTPIFLGKKNKCKIIPSTGPEKYEIVDEDGVRYLFFPMDETKANSADGHPGNKFFQTWNLTDIIAPDGQRIQLTYTKGHIQTLPTLSERLITDARQSLNGTKRTVIPSYAIDNYYLTRIETNNEVVEFMMDNVRPDVKGASRLTGIKVTDKNSNKVVKQFALEYDWFTGSAVGGNFLNDGVALYPTDFTQDHISKRLKLTGLKRVNPLNTNEYAEKYAFTYNESVPLPLKTSFAMDNWGFFNGEENTSTIMGSNATHTLLPGFSELMIQTDMYQQIIDQTWWEYIGACRGTSTNHITAGMLKSITYPTAGRTDFEYEPHTFGNNDSYSTDVEKGVRKGSVLYSVWDYNNQYSQASLTTPINITKKTRARLVGGLSTSSGKYTGAQINGATVTLYNLDGNSGYQPILYTSNGTEVYFDIYIDLNPGLYMLSCNSPGTIDLGYGPPIAYASLSVDVWDKSSLNGATKMGGGVRIKTISNFDNDSKLLTTQKYTYSGGKLLVPVTNRVMNFFMRDCMYIDYHGENDNQPRNGNIFNLSSENQFAASVSTVGNMVGYDSVKIENYDGTQTNGAEILSFVNAVPTVFYNKPIYEYSTNGDVTSQTYLNSQKKIVQRTEFLYQKAELYSEIFNAIVTDTYVGPIDYCIALGTDENIIRWNVCAFIGRYDIAVYPHRNFWSYLQKKTVTSYVNGVSKMTSTYEYTYNPLNYRISQEKRYASDGALKQTAYQYPVDLQSDAVYSKMVSLNMINPVVVQTETLDGVQLDKATTNYLDFVSVFPTFKNFVVPGSIVAQRGANPSEEKLVFDSYDSRGNILGFHKKNDISSYFIWGYNQAYPVVKIEGKSYSEIDDALKSTIGSHIFTGSTNYTDTEIKADVAWLKSQLTSLISDKSCWVTYYTYAPLIGMTSQTDTNGVTTFYEYDSFGRLKLIRDSEGNILNQYQYNYKSH